MAGGIDTTLDLQVDRLHAGTVIVRSLGEGASAIIYETKLKDGSHAIIKYYFKSDAGSVVYARNEYVMIDKLCHYSILSPYIPHMIATNDQMLLMRPVGRELTIDQLRNYLTQLVGIFRTIHRDLGIVHRDIQPNNLLLNDVADTLLIIDWACATEANKLGPYDGTIFYAAQELIPLVFTDTLYTPKPAHDLESLIKLLYHIVNPKKVDQCDVDICNLNEVFDWWDNALKDSPWPSYLKAAREEQYELLLEIIEQYFGTK